MMMTCSGGLRGALVLALGLLLLVGCTTTTTEGSVFLWPSAPINQEVALFQSAKDAGTYIQDYAVEGGRIVTQLSYFDSNWHVILSSFTEPSFGSKQALVQSASNESFPIDSIQALVKDGLVVLAAAASPLNEWLVVLGTPVYPCKTQLAYAENVTVPWLKALAADGRVVLAAASPAAPLPANAGMFVVTAATADVKGASDVYALADASMDALLSARNRTIPVTSLTSLDSVALISGGYSVAYPAGSEQVGVEDPDPQEFNRLWMKDYSYVPEDSYGFTVSALATGPSLSAGFMVINRPLGLEFTGPAQWPSAFGDVLNQGQCGSCFIFSTTEGLAIRGAITSAQPEAFSISPEPLVSCAKIGGCNGGYLNDVYKFMVNNGSTSCTHACTAGCAPYISGNCTEGTDKDDNGCTTCAGKVCRGTSTPWPTTHHAESYYDLHYNDEYSADDTAQRAEIATNGPAPTCFTLYENFYTFFKDNPTGIYNETIGKNLGGHCVLVIGWGEEDGMPFWLVRNSWGATWGDNGDFRYIRGKNLGTFDQYITPGVYRGGKEGRGVRHHQRSPSSDRKAKVTANVPKAGVFSSMPCADASSMLSRHGLLERFATLLNDVAAFGGDAALSSFGAVAGNSSLACEVQVTAGYKVRVHSTTAPAAVEFAVSHDLHTVSIRALAL